MQPRASQVGVLKYVLHYQDLCRNHLGGLYLLGCYFQKQREPLKGFFSCQSCHYWWEPLGCASKLRGRLRAKVREQEKESVGAWNLLRSSHTRSRKQGATQLRDESGGVADSCDIEIMGFSTQTISHVHLYSVRKNSFSLEHCLCSVCPHPLYSMHFSQTGFLSVCWRTCWWLLV